MNAEFTLVIGSRTVSSWSWRAWLAAKRTDVKFEEVRVVLDTPGTAAAIAAHSPSGKVPVLKHQGRVIWDSLAIGEYLAEQYPRADLWPRDPDARAYARSMVAEMHSGFSTLREALPMDLRPNVAPVSRSAAVDADIARIVQLWEEGRRRFGAQGPYLTGDYTLADIFYVPVASRFQTYGVPLRGEAAEYLQSLLEHPLTLEWQRAAATER